MSFLPKHIAALLDRYQLTYLLHSINRVYQPRQMSQANQLSGFAIPDLCCQVAGGDPGCAEHISAAWEALYVAAHLLDQVADDEMLFEERGQRVTLAAALQAAAEAILDETPSNQIPRRNLRKIQAEFHRSILIACEGQMADLQAVEPSLDQRWKISEAKTGQTFKLACRAGAYASGAKGSVVDSLGCFGLNLGMLVQIADDLNGLYHLTSPDGHVVRGDLSNGKWSLPVAYAMEVSVPKEQAKLRDLMQAACCDPESEAAARDLIYASGAHLYLLVEAEQRRSHARDCLFSVVPPCEARNRLLELLSIPVEVPTI